MIAFAQFSLHFAVVLYYTGSIFGLVIHEVHRSVRNTQEVSISFLRYRKLGLSTILLGFNGVSRKVDCDPKMFK